MAISFFSKQLQRMAKAKTKQDLHYALLNMQEYIRFFTPNTIIVLNEQINQRELQRKNLELQQVSYQEIQLFKARTDFFKLPVLI